MIHALRINLLLALALWVSTLGGAEPVSFSGRASLGAEGVSENYARDYLSWQKGIGFHRGLFATAEGAAGLFLGDDWLFSAEYSFNAAQGFVATDYFKMNNYLDLDYNLPLRNDLTWDLSLTAHHLFHYFDRVEQVFGDLFLSSAVLYEVRDDTTLSFFARGGYLSGLGGPAYYLDGPSFLAEIAVIHEKDRILRRIKVIILGETTLAPDIEERRPDGTVYTVSGKYGRVGAMAGVELGIPEVFGTIELGYDLLRWFKNDTFGTMERRRTEHHLTVSAELKVPFAEYWEFRLYYMMKKVFSTNGLILDNGPDYNVLLHTGGLGITIFTR